MSVLLGCATTALAQSTGQKVDRVDIKFVGPSSVSEDYIRANLKLKTGGNFMPGLTQDDIHSLYATGQFYNVRVSVDQADDGGVVLTYTVQARPRLTEIKFEGNKKLSDAKLKKKVTVKVGDALDEQKLFTDVQEMKKVYEGDGLSDTKVKYILTGDMELAGHATVIFHVDEAPKVKITDVEFIGAKAFPQKELRGELKIKRRWMFSWITGSGFFKEDEFDADRDLLSDFYRAHGYLDIDIKDVKLVHPTPNTMVIEYFVDEGRQYKVGSVKFSGNKIFTDAEIANGLRANHDFQHLKGKLGPNGLPMDAGDTFTPDGMSKDTDAVQDFYGGKGYVDISQGIALRVLKVPNLDKGTMDLEFAMDDSQKTYVQKIEIRGNLKTKDKVIRRELAINPGEVMDMVRVKISKQRLEGLDYFEKVDINPEPTDPPMQDHKNLVINVDEKNTGNFTVGAGFSSVDSLVGYAEVTQGNFDLFHPPYFTGGGEKMRLKVQLGTERQDYELEFIEPWFLNRKLSLDVDLYRHQLDFESPNNIYDETRTGVRVGLTRALGQDFLIGSIYDTIEDVGIDLNSGWHGLDLNHVTGFPVQPNVPPSILEQTGDHFFNRVGASLAYDTRNSNELPNHGQRSELTGEISTGDQTFYKIELHSSWYFPGLSYFFPNALKGHVIEIGGRAGVTQAISGGDVPFYDRYYLGGAYDLRGFKFRNIAPRDPNTIVDPTGHVYYQEPIGGDNFWFGSIEYSIPIFEKDSGPSLRLAAFYDIGAVGMTGYKFNGSYDDDYGLGIRLNIPRLGPLRLDYGIPINHDQFNSGGGKFQFRVGFTRDY
ncbi:MAG TPA: outer membrane protein assembly factor BamA [Candidatus Sulfotelmatobacter sp.]|nr:outer membrane protein assembly factor BamA [Candidatus Sulfotelmatobacter sp.]